MSTLNQITPQNLMRLIGTPDCPVLIDVCDDDDFGDDPNLIPTSFHHPSKSLETLVPSLQGKRVVVICKKGLKLSSGGAALLRSHGITAENIEGGKVAWRDAGLPFVPAGKLPANKLWVTRHRPKIDRIACPWLLRRFVDPGTRILYVPPSDVMLVAERYNAIPFDVPEAQYSHREELCTFDVLLQEFGLQSKALDAVAEVVRAADTNKHDASPQAAGLLAISVGLSRMYKDDTRQLDAGMAVYDALYRWARDGQEESHDSSGAVRS